MFDPTKPFSTFRGEPNGADFQFMQRQESIDNAIRYLVDLHEDDVDISDPKIVKYVLKHYGISDVDTCELARIETEVKRRIIIL